MLTIDSHVHIWTRDPDYTWAADASAIPPLAADPEGLLALMDQEAIHATVLVQYIGYLWDNSFVASVLKMYPDQFMGVCRVNPTDPTAPDQLSLWTELHGFHGVRISPHADARGDWFQGPLMRPLFQRAADLKVPILVLTQPQRLPRLLHLLAEVPDVDIVVDHLADCVLHEFTHRELLRALARHPRVFMKTGHVWANSTAGYPWRDQFSLLHYICEHFGANRLMWGSDWPFCLQHGSYAQSIAYLRTEADLFSTEDLSWILGGTAQRLWPFVEPTPPAVSPPPELFRQDSDANSL